MCKCTWMPHEQTARRCVQMRRHCQCASHWPKHGPPSPQWRSRKRKEATMMDQMAGWTICGTTPSRRRQRSLCKPWLPSVPSVMDSGNKVRMTHTRPQRALHLWLTTRKKVRARPPMASEDRAVMILEEGGCDGEISRRGHYLGATGASFLPGGCCNCGPRCCTSKRFASLLCKLLCKLPTGGSALLPRLTWA